MDIIMFSFTTKWADWEREGFASRSAVIARELGRHPQVDRLLLVNTPSSLFARTSRDRGRPRFDLEQVDDGVYVVGHTRLLPKERHVPRAYELNSRLFDRSLVTYLRDRARELGMKTPVLWLTGPLCTQLIGQLGEGMVVYDAVDDWLAHPAFRDMHPVFERGYRDIKERADVVFAVSPQLARRFEGGRPVVSLVPNGVDTARFRVVANGPDPLAGLGVSRPVVGYVGALHRRFDHELLTEVASRMTDVSFVLVGRAQGGEAWRRQPNVHHIGFRPAAEVPGLLAGFDACIVPHLETDLSKSMDPMKIYEFLAAGKPTVASRIGSLARFDPLVRLADGPDEFVSALRMALDGEWTTDASAVAGFLAESSWEERIGTMLEVIDSRMRGETLDA